MSIPKQYRRTRIPDVVTQKPVHVQSQTIMVTELDMVNGKNIHSH